MSKLFMWLATGHLGFLKLFGHFYKMLWYLFYQSKTNNRKTKKKSKRESLPVAHQRGPPPWPRPSPATPSVVFPADARAGSSRRGKHAHGRRATETSPASLQLGRA